MSRPNQKFAVPGGAVARLRIIDSTTKIKGLPLDYLMTPAMPGMDVLPEAPTWSFLVESDTGRKALFDLGVPPNWREFSPVVATPLQTRGWGEPSGEKHVADILVEEGVDLSSINSIIWSHWHYDHIGDPSTFPPSTELIVGPGFKEAFCPGWPARQDSPVRESDFAGRPLREITFSEPNALQIGPFPAYDLFGDGSFYLLDTPGHAIGHLAGLVRTTPDTFVMMGGDLCHHGGELRPSEMMPLPAQVQLPSLSLNPNQYPGCACICPGSAFQHIQETRGRKADEPFFDPAIGYDIPETIRTIKKVQGADAGENIFFIYAHDTSIRGVVDLFPATANEWKAKGWREKVFWRFLEDFGGALPSDLSLARVEEGQ
ncbi:hypothetical protein G647_09895 [Cladophialophora carrionii CBS 160.54]|uniref:Metallo-beta-lactamase domain-containing protein n=1 Tax=Cladophialophora carrionii CBS 160.54 TaxID=1279043 RepID=V9DMM4_9EURO|nr:uncharacterized protein G647_09895 [Cladophialophora carrionii CBS 160.54]ETI27212.1 hypothetical protein G647_09895 [Cladophialophora carrionii CBS 160.54]